MGHEDAASALQCTAAPPFESALLREIASAVEQRGKAIRYHGKLELNCDVEDSFERLSVDFEATHGFRVRLSICSDGHTRPQ